ncbi:MAG TPA: hypothetical protein VE641_00215 [Chthoniobacterales bacterium]|nr:hypothetical protein [Chthoniobacterales bacterium]
MAVVDVKRCDSVKKLAGLFEQNLYEKSFKAVRLLDTGFVRSRIIGRVLASVTGKEDQGGG